jgi:type II secretory pathway component PulM
MDQTEVWIRKLEAQLPATRKLLAELKQERQNVNTSRGICPSQERKYNH